MHEAQYYTVEDGGKVRCRLCPHECLIVRGKSGICRVRANRDGILYSLVYGQPAALHSDPVEKKPLYHFHPGKEILSVGTVGCNLRCSFCQNYNLSQCDTLPALRRVEVTPAELVRKAAALPGNIGIAYTYNEPTVFYEWMADTAQEAHKAGLANAVVSNGFINSEPLEKLLPLIDAFNIDLKSFNDDFYLRMTGGRIAPVLESLKAISQAGKHLEITFLVIPTLNDSEEEFRRMADWIARKLGPDTPLHLSRYFPAFKLNLPPTPLNILQNFARIAGEKLRYVFLGNVSTDEFSSTYCPYCKKELIRRIRYDTTITGLTPEGRCASCNAEIPVRLRL